MKCFDVCFQENEQCLNKNCRLWMDFPDDLNCSIIAIKKHKNLKTDEIAERLKLSSARISQLANSALDKMSKSKHLLNIVPDDSGF